MKTVLVSALTLVLLAGTAGADVLLLRTGGRVEGVVTERGDRYVVTSLHGTAEVKKDEVASRLEVPYVTEVYERRLASIAAGDADAHYELSVWCAGKGLPKRARENLEAAIAIDPDHAAARRALGHERFEGAWLTREEAREARLAKAGLVSFEGRWFTPEGLAAYVAAKKELAALRAEEEARRAQREEAERKAREEAERLAREEAERKAKEAALARAEDDRRARERLELENELLRERLRSELLRDRYDGYGFYVPGLRFVGFGAPSVYRGYHRGPYRPGCHGGGFGLDFRWSGDDFHVHGRVR